MENVPLFYCIGDPTSYLVSGFGAKEQARRRAHRWDPGHCKQSKAIEILRNTSNVSKRLNGLSTASAMGIKDLSKLIADVAPQAIKENEIKNYFGRKVAIDASMSLYQFLIAVRSEGAQLTSADGETTSHLMGTFYRTIRMVENGIKPVYVFDGKPPVMKAGELEKRTERRAEAEAALEKAKEEGNAEEIDKQNRRLVKVGKNHVEECKELLTHMGIPYVSAPCEVSYEVDDQFFIFT